MAGARSMRWSDRNERFLRPVRWLLALHGEQVLDIEAFGLAADRLTQGHRIHAPGSHTVASASDYEQVLGQAYVVVDSQQRKARIREQVEQLIEQAGLKAELDDALLDENAGLTEWPVAVIGAFDRDFLEVPEEALISSMQQHQKCFPVRNAKGELVNQFVAVANIESRDPTAMTSGFERVIRPRLADARFFWEQDCKISLEERRSRLDDVLFQEKLGSVGAKTRRLEKLVSELAASLGADPDLARRAAALSKSDLVTEMVGEFPELQGTMGGHYARVNGEAAEVAAAIASHYQPRHAGDALPDNPAGQALALADRLDTVVGVFAAGKKPKGGKDPFALRRAALGIVRILAASGCERPLDELIDAAATALASEIEVSSEVRSEVADFIMERLRSHAAEAGIDANTVHAVAAGKRSSISDFMARAQAVQAFTADPRAESLIAANKRASNLLRQAESTQIGAVNSKLLQEDAEKALFEAIVGIEKTLDECLAGSDYPAALTELAGIREPIDHFFDQVMVMCDDPALRANRLALLKRLAGLIADIADLARLGR
jgi:glycyl-tRNA synthetase beta chain